MTRHGKNCTAGAVYTYHEKKKDTGEPVGQLGGYGLGVRGTGEACWEEEDCGAGVRGSVKAGGGGEKAVSPLFPSIFSSPPPSPPFF